MAVRESRGPIVARFEAQWAGYLSLLYTSICPTIKKGPVMDGQQRQPPCGLHGGQCINMYALSMAAK